MLVAELTERRNFALTPEQSAADGLKMLGHLKTSLLPVVNGSDQTWLGNVYRHDLLPLKSTPATLGEWVRRDDAFIKYSHHIFDAVRVMLRQKVDVLPVLSEHYHYEGFITRDALNDQVVRLLNVEEMGQVLFVEMEQKDFTLAQIIRFVEEDNGRILGIVIDAPTTSRPTFRISIKINLADAGRIMASLNRHGFTVSLPNNDAWLDDEYGHRADELMHFLEM